MKSLKKKKEEQEKSITSHLFDENCPWVLLGLEGETNDFDDYRIALLREVSKKQILDNPSILLPEGSPDTPSLKRMLETCHCEVCDRDVERGSAAWLHIKQVMERPRKAMSNSDSLQQFYGSIQKATGTYETIIPNILNDYKDYMRQLSDLDEQIQFQSARVEKKESEMALVDNGNRTPDEDRRILSSYNQA